MKFWQTPAFRALEDEWYTKLAESGFCDAERRLGANVTALIQNATNAYRQSLPVMRESKAQYYRLLAQYAAAEPWVNSADQLIMTRRGEGVRMKDIAEELAVLGLKCHRQTVRFVIRRFELKWGIKEWRPEQLRTA